MNVEGRELVVELVRTRRWRRKAPVHALLCKECGGRSDFVSLAEAAQVFDIREDQLLGFIESRACHMSTPPSGDVHICLVTLLKAMREQTGNFAMLAE
jgi:hypothetical protein